MSIENDIIKGQIDQMLRTASVTGQDEIIQKAYDVIEKSKAGIYEDTFENRKLGRVNQKYGESHKTENMTIIEDLLDKTEPIREEMLKKAEVWFEEEFKHSMSEYDKQMYKLDIAHDMVGSFAKYTKGTDKLMDFNVRGSMKGSLTIGATIMRGGENHYLMTQVIYAGGHNIQRLHYRYLTETSLPRENTDSFEAKYKAERAKLTKAQKISEDLKYFHKLVQKAEEKIAINKETTDEQILDKNDHWQTFKNLTWQDMIDRGNEKNFDYKSENFIKSQNEYRASAINRFREEHGIHAENNIKGYKKDIAKLESKLKDLK